jgi:hypothetical protein
MAGGIFLPNQTQKVWNVNGNGNWASSANWLPVDYPGGVGDSALIDDTPGSSTKTITINANIALGLLTLSSAFTITIAVGSNIYFATVDGSTANIITTGVGSKTINAAVVLLTGLKINTSNGLTVVGVISGSFPIEINSPSNSTVTFGGINTFIGTITITAGTLAGAADNIFGDASNNIVLAGGTLTFTGATTSARNISVTANSNLNCNASCTISGTISGSSNLKCTINGGVNTITYSGTISLSGSWQLTNNTHLLSGTHSGTGNIINSINNPILIVTGSITSSTGTITGIHLKGTGSIAKAVTISIGLDIEASDGTTPGTLTLTNGLTMSSAGTAPDIIVRTSGSSVGKIAVTGNVVLKCNIQFPDSSLNTGTYDILTYTGTLTNNTIAIGATNNTGKTITLNIDTVNKKIQIIVT